MKKMKMNKKKGFTLVELIVVIAIIGVLAALIAPSILGYVNDSKAQKNLSNAKAVATHAQAVNAKLDNPVRADTAGGEGRMLWEETDADDAWGGTNTDGDAAEFSTELTALINLQDNESACIFVDDQGAITGVNYRSDGDGNASETLPVETSGSVTSGSWIR